MIKNHASIAGAKDSIPAGELRSCMPCGQEEIWKTQKSIKIKVTWKPTIQKHTILLMDKLIAVFPVYIFVCACVCVCIN